MSKLLVERCNITIVGAWNPAIITPNWIKREFHEFIHATQYEVSLTPAPVPRIRFAIEGLTIDPNAGRLQIRPTRSDVSRMELIPKLASAIYERLPHTPVTAVGVNFAYQLEVDEGVVAFKYVDYEEQERFYRTLDLHPIPQRQIRHSFAFPNSQLNLSYEARQEVETVSFNFHHKATKYAEVRSALKSFDEERAISEQLENKLIVKK